MNASSKNPIPDRSQSPYGKLIPSLQSVTRLPGALTKEVRKAVDYARRFNDEVARMGCWKRHLSDNTLP
jgi:hypothetical protein